MLFIGFGLFIGSMLLYIKVLDSLTARQNTYFRSWDQLHPFPASTLSLSMTLDEAFWGLSWARRLPEWLHRIREWTHRHLVIVMTATGIPIGLALVLVYMRTSEIPIMSDAVAPRALIGLAWAAAAALVVMIALWLPIVFLTHIFMRLTYGVGSVEHHLMVNVTVRRTPQIGDPSLVRHRNIALPLLQFLSEKWSLIHSKLYMDPRSTKEIVDWYQMLSCSGSQVSQQGMGSTPISRSPLR